MFESENFRFFFLSTKNSLTCTLGARGFLCAVSGFGQVLKSDPREKLFFFLAVSPAADKRKLPVEGFIEETGVKNNMVWRTGRHTPTKNSQEYTPGGVTPVFGRATARGTKTD